MSPHSRQRITLAAIVSGATLLLGSLGMLANGIITLDQKLGASAGRDDVFGKNDSLLFASDSLLWREVRAINRTLGRRTGAHAPGVRPSSAEDVGLVRRIWRLLF